MATNFPIALDNLSNPTGTTTLAGSGNSALSHSSQHANANDAIEAIQTRIGITGSTDVSSITHKLNNLVNQNITLSGDASGSGTSSINVTLANVGSAGTFTKVTTDAKGRVTSGTSLLSSDVPNLDWAKITSGKPTSLSGYGIADAYTKVEVDGLVTGLDFKQSVRVASVSDITLSGLQTIDGVSVIAGDRVLVKSQTSAAQNGIYVVAAGVWTRAIDADSSAKVTSGMYCFVNEGTINADSGWVLTTNDAITLNTTALAFTQFNGLGQITAGTGLAKSGSTLSLVASGVTASTYGGNNSIPSLTIDSFGRITSATTVVPSGTWAINVTGSSASCTGNAATAGTSVSISGGSIVTGINTVSVGTAGATNTQFMGNASNPAAVTFHRSGTYAINMGLDTDNVFRLGGWSNGTNVYRWTSDTVGNFVSQGNVSAYSDERVKTNWRDLNSNFVEQLATIKSGIYDRTDIDSTQVGVSAQSLQTILPEAVLEDEYGKLSVAYGNAALAACIALAKEVQELKARIAELESK